jgi:hypothetical protein
MWFYALKYNWLEELYSQPTPPLKSYDKYVLWFKSLFPGYRSRGPGFDFRALQKISGSGTGSTQPRDYNLGDTWWKSSGSYLGDTWWKSSGSCLENREYGRRDPSRRPRGTLYPQKLAITSPTSGGRSVGIVRSWTQTMEFSLDLKVC